jgi:hypothetical protein
MFAALARPDAFPALLVAIDVAAAARYAVAGSSVRCVYWLSAAALTACVTWGMR